MHCLDPNATNGAAADLAAVVAKIRGKRGAEFIYSRVYGEWMIVCRDLAVKRRLRARYKAGLAVYTLDEITTIGHYPPDMAADIHEMVRRFGVEVEEVREDGATPVQ